jgi:PPP family 3-phenylpropionic acid transporter
LVPEQTATSPIALRLSVGWAAWGTSGGIYTPFFGAWLAYKGMNPVEIGTLLSAGMLLRVIVPPITGIVADARNDRRSLMIVLFALQLVSYIALNWVMTPIQIFVVEVTSNVAGAAAATLMESIRTEASASASTMAMCADGIRSPSRSAMFRVGDFTLGMAVLAPWLTHLACAHVCCDLLASRAAARSADRTQHPPWRDIGRGTQAIGSGVFLLFLLAAGFDQGSHAFYYGYGGLHWRSLGYSGAVIGAIWPLGVVAEALLFSISLRLFRSIGPTRLLALGAIGCVVRWTILSFDPPFALVIFAQFLHGATYALPHLGAMYFILKAVPPRLSATAQSLYAVFTNGIVIGLVTLPSGRFTQPMADAPIFDVGHGRGCGSLCALARTHLAWRAHRGSRCRDVIDTI